MLYDKNKNLKKIKNQIRKHKVKPNDFLRYVPKNSMELLEYIGKLKNAYLKKDELNIFYAARVIAEKCYRLLRPFNPVWKFTSEKETYPTFLQLKKKPKHYAQDFRVCYGLTMKKRNKDQIYKSALRLASETVEFLKENNIEKKIKDKEFLSLFNSKGYMKLLK